MDEQQLQYETKRLDHLGIVAGICKRIGLIDLIDQQLPTPGGRKVSCGQATQAMILNALGLSGRALYLMPEYMKNKPVDLLIGEGLVAEDFNDDTLGRALDELQQAGVTGMFASIAAEAVKVYEIEVEYMHLDSSSFTLHGSYDSEYAQKMSETYNAVQVKHGYSKDKRPDLKQVVVNLITSQASALPLWLEALDGNSSDQVTFRQTITNYCDELQNTETTPRFVFDSAGYSADNLQAWHGLEWITRVPETNSLAKETIRSITTDAMTGIDDNYKATALCTQYAGVKQRWLLVYSQQAFEREEKQWRRRLQKQQKMHTQTWRKLCRQQYSCQADATTALKTFAATLPWWQVQATVEPVKKYRGQGRPAKDAIPEIIGWRLQGEIIIDEAAVADEIQWLGRFILATNVLDENSLSDAQLLTCYKEQSSSVERGFRFLKDPMFFADNLFVKSPVRVMAMIMVMGLALLIYSLAERELRHALVAQETTVPDQTVKPTQKITMRRVAQIFEGVDLLIIRRSDAVIERRILNLTPIRLKIISLFHPSVHNCYLLNF